jgi:hypothetical protein
VIPSAAPSSGGRPRGSRVSARRKSVRALSARSARVERVLDQGAIERSDRTERFAAPPGGKVDVAAVWAAACEHALAHAVPKAEQRINAREGARAGADGKRRRHLEALLQRLEKAALPIAPVAAAGERDGVEHVVSIANPRLRRRVPQHGSVD